MQDRNKTDKATEENGLRIEKRDVIYTAVLECGHLIGLTKGQYEHATHVRCYKCEERKEREQRGCHNCGANVGAGCAAMQQNPADAGYTTEASHMNLCDGWIPPNADEDKEG